jgi:hypothetical protein
MNKVYYGAVEKTQVDVRVEDNTTELTPDEVNERMILLTQGADGTYSSDQE